MLQKITSFEQLRALKEIILGNSDVSNEKYKIIQIDNRMIKMIRRGEYSRLRILQFEDILVGDWYFDLDEVF